MCDRRESGRKRWSLLLAAFCLVLTEPLLAAVEPLRIGIFPRRNATETVRLFTPLVNYLAQELDRPVQLITAKDFSSFWNGVETGRFDLVHYNQYHYVRSADRYSVIAHNEEFGRGTVAGALYVRNDSDITDVSQLKGRAVLFGGGPDAMMSYVLPRYLLQQAGLSSEDYQSRFAPNPPNVLMALYFQQADAGGGGDILKDIPLVRKQIDTTQLRILASTEPLMHLPWAVSRNLPPPLQANLQRLLLQLPDSESGRGVLKQAKLTGIGRASDSDYDRHRTIIAAVERLGS